MAAIVERVADAADEAVLEAMGFNAFACDLAEALHEMAAADADEAVLEALGFNAFARELEAETVHDMAALNADALDEAAVEASGFDDFVRKRAEAIVVVEGIVEAADGEEAASDAMEFDAFVSELRDIRARDEEAFLEEMYCEKISRAIYRALEYQREEAGAAAAAAMPRHVACG